MMLGRCREAVPVLKRYLGRYPDHVWAHVRLATVYSMSGDDDAARAEGMEVERAAALNPNSAFGYVALAEVMNVLGRSAEALAAVEKAVRLDPGNRDRQPLYEQAWAYTHLGQWQAAIPLLKRYLARYPNDFWAHALLAIDRIEVGQNDAARTEAAEVLRLNPQFSAELPCATGGMKRKAPSA